MSTPVTPEFRNEMEEGDEEALLPADHNQRRRSTWHYEQMDSWKRLARVGIIKFLMTISFGASLCLCLKAWEGFHGSIPLSKHDIRIFNALTIGISICLGLNLLTSLKRYAVFLRWAILTMFWVPVEVFDLVLGIDELTNVARLFVLSIPILSRRRWLRGTSRPWKNAQPYTKLKFATVCSIWLLINIGSQVLVASLSLFWPTEAYVCPLTKYGSVSVADLTKWSKDETRERNFTSYEASWRYGMEAQAWSNVSITEPPPDLSQLPGAPIYKGDSFYEYRFFYRNPDRLYSDYLQSDRGIKATARCTEHDVVNITSIKVVEGKPTGFNVRIKGLDADTPIDIQIPEYGYGMLVYVGSTKYDCGPRCSRLTVFQGEAISGDLKTTIYKSSLWICENEISEVYPVTNGTSHSGKTETDERIVGTDGFARIAAGAIAWTGNRDQNWNDRQWRLYTQRTPFSPPYIPEKSKVEEIIERFSIGAIASFDDHGIRYNITINNETCDKDSQKINVSWHYVLGILGAIVGIQFGALCYLLARANKSIVRDSSYFSVAMLLQPILKVVDDMPGRMAMTGVELKDHANLRDRNIRYDYKELPDKTKQVTVYFEDEWKGHMRKKWPSGDYSG